MCLAKPHKQGGLISKLLGLSLWLHQMNTNAQMYFRSHRFRNVQVEVLYQRYFLRMNQNNMVSLLGLLICISLVLIVTNHLMYSSNHSSLLQVSNMLLYEIWYVSKSLIFLSQGVTLGVFTLMYLLLVILMTRCFLNEVYLIIFSYSKCITHIFSHCTKSPLFVPKTPKSK